jgi:hypothetical protein
MRSPILALALVLLLPVAASAREQALESLAAVRTACQESAVSGPRQLYTITVPTGAYRFLPYDAEAGFLGIDTRRNLRAFSGSLEVFPSGREPMGFFASAERAEILRTLAARASLRVGFFLGFDDSTRSHCVIRAALATSTARIDLAYVELVDTDGRVLAREDTERFRAVADDRAAVPGTGPRAEVGAPDVVRGGAPAATLARAVTQAREALGRAAGQCFAQAITRDAPREASIVVRLVADASTGAVTQAGVEMSTLGDDQASACIAEQFRGLPRTPGPAAGGAIVLLVPLRLVAD